MLPDSLGESMGKRVYQIEAGNRQWAGIGPDLNRRARMGFGPEWLDATVYVSREAMEIPEGGLSLRQDGSEIGPKAG
jgi:hypothetical protein